MEVTVTLDDYQQRIMVNGLVEFRTVLQEREKPTEDVDELILKIINAPPAKHGRKRCREER